MTDCNGPAVLVDPTVVERSSSPRRQASTWAAKASLISITSISERLRPARASAFFEAATGPMPMIRGGTPATALARTRTSGSAPTPSPAGRLATIIATAPSLIPDALPARRLQTRRAVELRRFTVHRLSLRRIPAVTSEHAISALVKIPSFT